MAFGKSMDPAASASASPPSPDPSADDGDGDESGPIGAACAALVAAGKTADVAAALDTAKVITLTFAPDGSIEVDVDGATASISADEVMGGEPADASQDSAPTGPPAPPVQF